VVVIIVTKIQYISPIMKLEILLHYSNKREDSILNENENCVL